LHAIWGARDDVGKGAAAIDPELPAGAHIGATIASQRPAIKRLSIARRLHAARVRLVCRQLVRRGA
jgi:hypothetical protein